METFLSIPVPLVKSHTHTNGWRKEEETTSWSSGVVSLTVLPLDLPPSMHHCICEIQTSLCKIFISLFVKHTHTHTLTQK